MISGTKRRRGFAVLSAGVLLLLAACHASTLPYAVRLSGAPRTNAEHSLPLAYWSEQRSADTLAIHVVRVDLRSSAIELDVMVADDPDGSGPAEAALTDPRALAQRSNVLVAVNANAFAGIPDATGKPDSRWRAGLPVNIAGIAVHDGVTRSRGADSSAVNVIFGIDGSRRPYVGRAPAGVELQEAVNGWSFRMLEGGQAVPRAGGVRHPRTAAGVDRSGRWLYLVVVDGRQPGYSVGMTPRELADLMIRLGVERAVNLDGGGSSVLLIAGASGELQVVNRPSGGNLRPVPVLLTIRKR